jgi:hypothetical protein
MRLREILGISERTQHRITRAMQAVLLSMTLVGFYQVNVRMIFSSLIPLAASFAPAAMRKDPDVTMDTGIVLWVTAAAFLHAIGTYGFYDVIQGFDHLTHAFSATVVAGTGYGIVRAIDTHADGVKLQDTIVFAFLLIFTMAFGVMWEVGEFFAGIIGNMSGTGAVLIQHGIADTMKDMTFNMVGAVLIATWGQIYLTGVVETMAEFLGYDRLVEGT